MKFDIASEVEQVCYEFKLGDYPRGKNRALINDLFNGVPPYTPSEVESNKININVNSLEGTRMAHDARAQFYGAFLKPGRFFQGRTDMGPKHKRSARSAIVTSQVNRVMKRSMVYFETFRSKLALDVLHGIGPSSWEDRDGWCPDANGIEDILVPSNTLLTMKNLPFFAIYRSYTAPQLIRLVRGPRVDPGWNVELAERCIEWVDEESQRLMGSNWPEVWAPEKMSERVKSDGGFYASDQVPTVDCFDFYFWNDDRDDMGWRRRIILDCWSTPQSIGGVAKMGWNSKLDFARNQFLYNSKNRKFASRLSEVICWQFADLSAVAPFRYHSVRGLGFLLYSVCHLQNRLRCKFNEAVFEALMNYFRVRSVDDAERALKIELVNQGFVDESVQFVPAAERWQVNHQLVQLGLQENSILIGEHSQSMTPRNEASTDRREKTKFQVMAEMNEMMVMVASAFQQAYCYQNNEYYEIFRRFCNKHSVDPDVLAFRAACLRQGVPENMLVPEAWDLEPERVMGAGNKTLEMAIAEQLMAYRPLFDPEPQREILRDVTMAITDDPARAERLVPDDPIKITDSVHDAQVTAAALMMGLPVGLKTGMNHIEYVNTMLLDLQLVISKANRTGMADGDKIEGMVRLGDHIRQHIDVIAQDQAEKERVVAYQKQLSKMMNDVRAFAQRLEEQRKAGNGAQQLDPETQAKIQAMIITAQANADKTAKSHAQRTAQRQVQFEQEMRQREQEHELDMQKKALESGVEHQRRSLDLETEAAKTHLEGAKERLYLASEKKKADIDIRKARMKSLQPKKPSAE